MSQYKDNNGKIVGEVSTISAYFKKPDESFSQFSTQLKALSPADKTELADGAAKNMGWEKVEESSVVVG